MIVKKNNTKILLTNWKLTHKELKKGTEQLPTIAFVPKT